MGRMDGLQWAARSPIQGVGWVAEWFKAPVLKTGVPARVPWVRIPPLPPVANGEVDGKANFIHARRALACCHHLGFVGRKCGSATDSGRRFEYGLPKVRFQRG